MLRALQNCFLSQIVFYNFFGGFEQATYIDQLSLAWKGNWLLFFEKNHVDLTFKCSLHDLKPILCIVPFFSFSGSKTCWNGLNTLLKVTEYDCLNLLSTRWELACHLNTKLVYGLMVWLIEWAGWWRPRCFCFVFYKHR